MASQFCLFPFGVHHFASALVAESFPYCPQIQNIFAAMCCDQDLVYELASTADEPDFHANPSPFKKSSQSPTKSGSGTFTRSGTFASTIPGSPKKQLKKSEKFLGMLDVATQVPMEEVTFTQLLSPVPMSLYVCV